MIGKISYQKEWETILRNNLYDAVEYVTKITGNVALEKERGNIDMWVNNLMGLLFYKQITLKIDFVTQCFVRLLSWHLFDNCNKRVAITFLKIILEDFDCKLNFGVENWNKICEKFVVDLQNKDTTNFNLKEIKNIKEWIIQNTEKKDENFNNYLIYLKNK